MLPVKTLGFLSSTEKLADIMGQIDAITRKPRKDLVFVVDNISALLVYNKEDAVVKLLHFLYGKAEVINASAVFVSLKDESVPKSIGQYADRIVEIKYVY